MQQPPSQAARQPNQEPELTADAVRKTPYSNQLKDKIEVHVTAEMARLNSLSDQGPKAAGLQQIVDLLRALNDIKEAAAHLAPAPTPATSTTITLTLQSAISVLSDPTKTEAELVQACATLKGSRNEAAEMALFESLSNQKFQAVRNAAAEALAGFGSGKVLESLVSKLGSGEEATVRAATALRGNREPRAVRSVFQALWNTEDTRIAAALQGVTLPDVVTKLTSWLSAKSGNKRFLACVALKGNSDHAIQKKIITHILCVPNHLDFGYSYTAAGMLQAIPLSKGVAKRIIAQGLTHEFAHVRTAAVLALSNAPRSVTEPVLRWCVINDTDEGVRQKAATLLGSNSYEQLSIQLVADPSLAIKEPRKSFWGRLNDRLAGWF